MCLFSEKFEFIYRDLYEGYIYVVVCVFFVHLVIFSESFSSSAAFNIPHSFSSFTVFRCLCYLLSQSPIDQQLHSLYLFFCYYCPDPGPAAQNIPQWHIDYFERKLLEKQPVRGGHVDPPLSP